MNWYLTVMKKYLVFTGRSRRKEYWMFVLINFGISVAISIVENMVGFPGTLSTLYALAVLIPSVAVGIRRLHDTSRSGWWMLIGLIPILGWIALLVFFCIEGDAGDNEYGPNPKAGEVG